LYRNKEEQLKRFALNLTFYGLAACFVFVTAAPSFANVAGELETGGDGTVTVTATGIQFTLNDSTGYSTEVGFGTDLTFATCPTGVLGTPGCLKLGEGIIIDSGATLTGTTSADFLAFQSNPSLVFDLTAVDPGSSNTDCAISPCSVIPGSHIILDATPDGGTDAVLGLAGFVSDNGFATEEAYTGHFTAAIAGLTPSEVQSLFLADGSFTHTYAGDFLVDVTATPEPRLIWVAGLAGIFLMVAFRKRQKQA